MRIQMKRGRSAAAGAAAALALATGGALASTALPHVAASTALPHVRASIVGDPATAEQAGYQFGGAQFEGAHATVYLRQAAQFAPSVGGLGQSVQFWGGGKVYVLGVSDATSSSPWSPALAVFDATSHALICATSNGTCPGTPSGWSDGSTSYPSGDSVRLSGFYNRAQGTLHFSVRDETAGTASGVTADAGTGVSFNQVRIGTEFGNDPWTAPSFTAPAAQQKTAAFTSGGLINYKGKALSFTSYETAAELVMTGAGSVTEADAGPLGASGFSTFLEP